MENSRAATPNRTLEKQVNYINGSTAQPANPRRDSFSSNSSVSQNAEKSWREKESHRRSDILRRDEPQLKLSYADRTRPARYILCFKMSKLPNLIVERKFA